MRSYLYPLLLLLAFIFSSTQAKATHWRGGYIHYTLDEQNPLKAYFTMTVYTKSSSPADDPVVIINMGDENIVRVDRFSRTPLENDVDVNLYKWEYTFPGAGTYTAVYNGLNRNGGILNLGKPTDQISFAIKTEIKINPLNPNRHGVEIKKALPILAYGDIPLRFNLLAYDLDGDSLGYELIAPLHKNSQGIITAAPGYTTPIGFGINRFGEIYWEGPKWLGEYNHAVRITQYRKGLAIGHTVLDMQFLVVKDRPYYIVPKLELENKDELTFLKDGRLLVKPGEKVTLRLLHNQYPKEVSWQSELQEEDIEASIRRVSDIRTEFSFTATEALSRRQTYGVNLNYLFVLIPETFHFTFTFPLLIWEPEPIELALREPDKLPKNAEGQIIAKPGAAVKLLVFAKNGLGHTPELTVESSLRKDAELFSFVTRDSADSQVGELIFKPSENQISTTPYTITVRSTPMQPRSLVAESEEPVLTLQLLVSAAMPTSAGPAVADGGVRVYPNPMQESITVSTQHPNSTFTLYAVDGRVVYQAKLLSGDNRIARPAALQPGLHTYTITSPEHSSVHGKLLLL